MGYVHCEADHFFETAYGYAFDRNKLRDAHDKCQSNAFHAMRSGRNVVVANTFTQRWEMAPYIDEARRIGHRVSIITATGEWQNEHGVPDEAIQRMRDRWEAAP